MTPHRPVLVCVLFTQCWPCMFDDHYDPPRWHTWADAEDVEHAATTGQPDPRASPCACSCATEAEGAP